MPPRRRQTEGPGRPKRPPGATLEAREQQLVGLAVDLAERQMAEGTASSQVISHFLKLGSTRERLEQERLAQENLFLGAKIAAMESAQRVEELYAEALIHMRAYSGQDEALEITRSDDFRRE